MYYSKNTNECSIYNNRPEICRVEIMYEKKYKKTLSLHEFYRLNAKICNLLQKTNSIDTKYRIKIGE